VSITDQLRELVEEYRQRNADLKTEITLLKDERDTLQRQIEVFKETPIFAAARRALVWAASMRDVRPTTRDEANEVAKQACGFKG
jgi:predicted RNase H-like nuclease (RuvC/YqgF family)